MPGYDFFIAQLRFVANRTDRESGDVLYMMEILEAVCGQIEGGRKNIFFAPKDLRLAARALAGVAGFLQQHIIPEVVAAKNTLGEKQVRWTIDTCMFMVAELLAHAELTHDKEGLSLSMPPYDCTVH